MTKKKTIMRLISKILFVCLVINTLPASFPVHAKKLTLRERQLLRLEVNRDVKQVKRTVGRLKLAKNVVPVLVFGAGTVIAAVMAVLVWIFVRSLRKNLLTSFKNKIDKLDGKITRISSLKEALNKQTNTLFDALKYDNKQVPHEITELLLDLSQAKKLLPEKFQKQVEKIYTRFVDPENTLFFKKENPGWEKLKQELTPVLEVLKKKLNPSEFGFEELKLMDKLNSAKLNKNLLPTIMAIAMPIVSVFTGLFGFLGTISTAIFARIQFSGKSVNKAADLVRKLEKIENEFPGVLTSEQRLVLVQFKKLAGDLTIQAILQNLSLRAKLKALIDTLIQQNQALTDELGGEEEARKNLEKYFTRRLRKALLKRNLDKADAKLKALGISFIYGIAKRKVAKMEKKYPLLADATKDAIENYIEEANKIFEKFNDLLAEAIVDGRVTPQIRAEVEPIIPL